MILFYVSRTLCAIIGTDEEEKRIKDDDFAGIRHRTRVDALRVGKGIIL